MSKILSFLSVFVMMFVLGLTPALAVEVGSPAPQFQANTASGQVINLSDFKGKIVVLEWSNFECPFVRKHYDTNNMQSLQKKYTDQGVVWLTVFSSAPGKQGYYEQAELLKRLKDEKAVPTHAVMDAEGTLGRMFDAKTTPHMYIIDANGTLVYQGAIDSIRSTAREDVAKAENYVSSALDQLMAGQPITTASTNAYGCSVKYN